MKWKMTEAAPDPKRVWLDEKDCERLTNPEYRTVEALYVLLHFVANADKDLSKRLESIPHGIARMRMVHGGIRAIVDDIIGTMTRKQATMLYHTIEDKDVRILPKMTPKKTNILLDRETFLELVDCAREQCVDCTKDDQECRKCKLYQILEATLPLTDYGDGLFCPYSQFERFKKEA